VLFEPVDGFRVEVVGRFIEQQHVGFLKQQTTESHTTTLTTAEVFRELVAFRTAQCIHCALQLVVEVPRIGGVDDVLQFRLPSEELIHLVSILVVFRQCELLIDVLVFVERIHNVLHSLLHDFPYGLRRVEVRVLRQVAYGIPWGKHHLSLVLRVESSNDFHQCGFSSTIQTDDTNFCSIEEREVDVFQHLLLVLLNGFAHTHHREDDFLVVNCCHKLNVE